MPNLQYFMIFSTMSTSFKKLNQHKGSVDLYVAQYVLSATLAASSSIANYGILLPHMPDARTPVPMRNIQFLPHITTSSHCNCL